jgi:hypothetical protein
VKQYNKAGHAKNAPNMGKQQNGQERFGIQALTQVLFR